MKYIRNTCLRRQAKTAKLRKVVGEMKKWGNSEIMNEAGRKKLYCYIDESGQDTEGRIFVVGIVLLEEELEKIKGALESIEEKSGKKNIKWHKSRHQSRVAYLKAIAHTNILENTIYFETFTNTKQYLEMTVYAAAKAICKRAGAVPCAVSF